jgi:hypothetical protein
MFNYDSLFFNFYIISRKNIFFFIKEFLEPVQPDVGSSGDTKTLLLELLHTNIGFIFPKFIPCLLVIISHYLVSYILGENIPPGEYSLSVNTSV